MSAGRADAGVHLVCAIGHLLGLICVSLVRLRDLVPCHPTLRSLVSDVRLLSCHGPGLSILNVLPTGGGRARELGMGSWPPSWVTTASGDRAGGGAGARGLAGSLVCSLQGRLLRDGGGVWSRKEDLQAQHPRGGCQRWSPAGSFPQNQVGWTWVLLAKACLAPGNSPELHLR